jgi:hypothetical protein
MLEHQRQFRLEVSFPTISLLPLLKTMDAKLDRILVLLEKEQYQPMNEIQNKGGKELIETAPARHIG